MYDVLFSDLVGDHHKSLVARPIALSDGLFVTQQADEVDLGAGFDLLATTTLGARRATAHRESLSKATTRDRDSRRALAPAPTGTTPRGVFDPTCFTPGSRPVRECAGHGVESWTSAGRSRRRFYTSV